MPESLPELNLSEAASSANEVAHKLSRQIEGLRDWLEGKDSLKDANCPPAAAVIMRPLNQVADARAALFDALVAFSQIAKHLGAPVCE